MALPQTVIAFRGN